MSQCNNCGWAAWQRSSNGNLHPSGDGKCNYQITLPILPAAMYWTRTPSVAGGWISRKNNTSEQPCQVKAQV